MTAVAPEGASLAGLAAAAASCTGCELHDGPRGTVFATGPATARIAFLGEQPGDVEDRQGVPFVGPAGQLLDRALVDAGTTRDAVYVTNAVKHFRFRLDAATGRRLHVTPDLAHMTACAPWWRAELAIVDPEVLVLLGTTAARAVLGPDVRIGRDRGVLRARPTRDGEPGRRTCAWVMVTTHPSAVLRADDQEAAYAALVADLRTALAALA